MLNHNKYMKPSRRSVQRRFPPGTLVVSNDAGQLMLVVGWVQIPPVFNKFGHELNPLSWAALVAEGGRIRNIGFESLNDCWPLDEYAQFQTLAALKL